VPCYAGLVISIERMARSPQQLMGWGRTSGASYTDFDGARAQLRGVVGKTDATIKAADRAEHSVVWQAVSLRIVVC
jgi:hypothetical protein